MSCKVSVLMLIIVIYYCETEKNEKLKETTKENYAVILLNLKRTDLVILGSVNSMLKINTGHAKDFIIAPLALYSISIVSQILKAVVEINVLFIFSRYGRVEPMVLGKFSLNVTKCPTTVDGHSFSVPNEISNFFDLVTTKVKLFLMFPKYYLFLDKLMRE